MLNLLLNYVAAHGIAAKPAFKAKRIRWSINTDTAGKFLGVTEFGDPEAKYNKGERFDLCPHLEQPEIKRGPTGCRHFLVDTAQVVTLFKAAKASAEQHACFVALLRQAVESASSVQPVLDALQNEAGLEQMRKALAERKADPRDNVTFAVVGENVSFPVRQNDWHPWWQEYRKRLAEFGSQEMLDFATGERGSPLLSHLVISGLLRQGGQPAGDRLASYKQGAFQSYGLTQGENAVVTDEAAAAYRAALDDMLDEDSPRSRSIAGAKVAYWYAGPGAKMLSSDDDPMEYALSMVPEDGSDMDKDEPDDDQSLSPEERAELDRQAEAQAGGRVRKLLEAIRKGERPDLVETRFYALSLAANSGRVVVRDWMQGEFTDLAASVLRWVEDLSIVRLDSPQVPDRVPKLETLVTCVLPVCKPGQKYGVWVKPAGKLREPLWRAAVGMKPSQNLDPPPIPEDAISILLPRWRASVLNGELNEALDGHRLHRGILYARASLIKAHLIRSGVVMEPHLFEDHPEPAYHCGRLLAVLANVQQEALGDVGANVVQRYYARASVAPADAIGPLITLSNRHLDKLEPGLADHLQGQIADVFGKLSEQKLPATLDTVKQSLFAMGFYQQIARMRHERAANVAKKRERDEAAASTSTESET